MTKSPKMQLNSAPSFANQKGATLVVALFMLLLISLLAVGGMQGSIMQERMASNAHDGAISFQASEAGLRQGEADLIGSLASRRRIGTIPVPRSG